MSNKRSIARQALIASFLAEFSKGARTLKDLAICQNAPENTVNKLIDQGYIVKVSRGVYKWKFTIKPDNIDQVAKMISDNWGNQNVYGQKPTKLIGDFRDSELIDEINRRGIHLLYDIQSSKFVIR